VVVRKVSLFIILNDFFFSFTENSLPKPKLPEDSVISPYNISTGYSGLATGNGLSDSPAGSKDHGNVPIIVPLIPPPFIKPPAGKSLLGFPVIMICRKLFELPSDNY